MDLYHSIIEPILTGTLEISSTIRMVQINVNAPKQIPVSSIKTETIDKIMITETLANSINTEILVTVSTQILPRIQYIFNPTSERKLSWMWTQQQMCEITDNEK